MRGYLSKNGSVTQVPVHFGANAYVIKEDRSGRIWIGTKGDGLYSLVPEGDKNILSVIIRKSLMGWLMIGYIPCFLMIWTDCGSGRLVMDFLLSL